MHEGDDDLGVPSGSAVPCGLLSPPVVSPHYSAEARIPQQDHRTAARPWREALHHGTSLTV